MSKLTLTLAVAGYIIGVAGSLSGFAHASGGHIIAPQSSIIFAQEDCKEGETWNEETQTCEVKES